jgi:hypothetical protein
VRHFEQAQELRLRGGSAGFGRGFTGFGLSFTRFGCGWIVHESSDLLRAFELRLSHPRGLYNGEQVTATSFQNRGPGLSTGCFLFPNP